ncbi:hypothetical protein [Vibrio agarivorans]|uniref:Uncharacterized protein n=1 Tax=Vibrio agarivorans TaxID=153622 RepID=A0ABT7Y743_9VIBR|nr:hypothetical protein [Vibrio agarivorans]MDN2483881.1 hypothetical protein [Vibrio agarivorans]
MSLTNPSKVLVLLVEEPETVAVEPSVRNSLFWQLRDVIARYGDSDERPFDIEETQITFNRKCPVYDVKNTDLWALARTRGYFHLGIEFTHPLSGTKHSVEAQFDVDQTYGFSSVEGLPLYIHHSWVSNLSGETYSIEVRGVDVPIQIYTPMIFKRADVSS